MFQPCDDPGARLPRPPVRGDPHVVVDGGRWQQRQAEMWRTTLRWTALASPLVAAVALGLDAAGVSPAVLAGSTLLGGLAVGVRLPAAAPALRRVSHRG